MLLVTGIIAYLALVFCCTWILCQLNKSGSYDVTHKKSASNSTLSSLKWDAKFNPRYSSAAIHQWGKDLEEQYAKCQEDILQPDTVSVYFDASADEVKLSDPLPDATTKPRARAFSLRV